jgi:hypothetical protein
MHGVMKDFQGWSDYQISLEERTRPHRVFHEGQIWRCAIGVNTGMELDGKSSRYWRPVLIVRKFHDLLFIGVPLTSTANGRPYHLPITVKGETSYAA